MALRFRTYLIGASWLVASACSDSSLKTDPNTPPGSTPGNGTTTTKSSIDLSGDITANQTLSSKNDYLLRGIVFVKSGSTLTIEKGTTIKGEAGSKGTLVVQPGARLVAEGTADEPIVFTSQASGTDRRAGDWGGIILLGIAPANIVDANGNPTKGHIEGITTGGEFGGSNADDDSGVLKYVRIEYAGVQLSPDNEINGLTLGGVGRGTKLSYIQVRMALDDCFEFFGGTVNADHLACQWNQDDGFDWDNGYSGKLQYLVLQQDPEFADDTNGFEGDNDAKGSTAAPQSNPTIYNATLCGKNRDVAKQQYGMLLRRNTRAHIYNTIAVGFEAGLDIRDSLTADSAKNGGLVIQNSIFFGMVGNSSMLDQGIAYREISTVKDALDYDDDGAFDEAAWWIGSANHNSVTDPRIGGCFDSDAPTFGPAVPLADGAAPPNDGFFNPTATYIGAFKNADDKWATTGKWAVWSKQ